MKKWYSSRYFLNLHLKYIHLSLTKHMDKIEFYDVDQKIHSECLIFRHQLYLRKQKKIKQLAHMKNDKSSRMKTETKKICPCPCPDPIIFHDRVINLSDTQFKNNEIKLLNKGLKYAPDAIPKSDMFLSLAIDSELALRDQPISVKTEAALRIQELSNENISPSKTSDNKTLISLKNKITKKDLIISKADKGQTITILNRIDYIKKIEDFISSSGAEILKLDPTDKYQKHINTTLTKIGNNLPNKFNPFFLKLMNPHAPILYGLPKIHKNNIPIRPVVSYVNAPAVKICKYLNNLLNNIFVSPFSVSNSLDLIDSLQKVKIQNSFKLISFDITNLFPSIPITDLKIILSKLINSSFSVPSQREHIQNLLDICLNQNYYIFNNTYYRQNEGLPMGSPLSPLLAEIFMSIMEETILKPNKNKTFFNSIKFWRRYVDDILVIWSGSDRQIQLFINYLNKLHKNIHFTSEIGNGTLAFLDLQITLTNNKLEYKIFRKPTFTDTVIPFTSNHPMNTKLSAFYSMFNRLIRTPMNTTNFNSELNIIYTIGKNNGYDTITLEKIFRKINRKFIISKFHTLESESDKIYSRLPFISDHISNPIARILQKK